MKQLTVVDFEKAGFKVVIGDTVSHGASPACEITEICDGAFEIIFNDDSKTCTANPRYLRDYIIHDVCFRRNTGENPVSNFCPIIIKEHTCNSPRDLPYRAGDFRFWLNTNFYSHWKPDLKTLNLELNSVHWDGKDLPSVGVLCNIHYPNESFTGTITYMGEGVGCFLNGKTDKEYTFATSTVKFTRVLTKAEFEVDKTVSKLVHTYSLEIPEHAYWEFDAMKSEANFPEDIRMGFKGIVCSALKSYTEELIKSGLLKVTRL